MGRRTRWLAMTMLFACLLSSCSSTSADSSRRPALKLPARVTLRLGTGDNGSGLAPHKEVIAQFEKSNPDIQIQLEPVAGNNYYDLLLQEIAAGNAPDIMQIGDDAVPRFVTQGAFVDLGPYIDGTEPLDRTIFLPGVFAPGAWEGKQYFLPKDYTPLAIYYNKKLFDQQHVPYPRDGWTWEDFLTTAKALTTDSNHDGTPDVWGVQLPAAWTGGFEYWVAAAGGSLIGEDGKHFQGYLDSPETIAALRFYVDLYNKYKVAPPPLGISVLRGGNQDFVGGTAAMLISGHWPESDLNTNPAIVLGVVGMPTGKKRANVLFWSGFGIYSGSKHKEEAWRYLRYSSGEQGAKVWKNWGLPSVKAVAESSGMTQDPIESVWLGELSFLAPRAYVFSPHWSDTADPILMSVLERAISDPQSDPSVLLSDAAKQAEAAFDKLN